MKVSDNNSDSLSEHLSGFQTEKGGVRERLALGLQKAGSGSSSRNTGQEVILVVVHFRVRGIARFLSHAETVRVFQRACARAGIEVEYSHGFNPRPRMSLPLPRTVGVESDDDLLCFRAYCGSAVAPPRPDQPAAEQYKSHIQARLSEQLPDGFDVLSVNLAEGKASFQPRSATYLFPMQREQMESLRERLADRIQLLMDSKSLNVERQLLAAATHVARRGSRGEGRGVRNLDVRPFLKSIEAGDKDVVVQCRIDPVGSIRIEEVLRLLELDPEKLTAPIRRISVEWQKI